MDIIDDHTLCLVLEYLSPNPYSIDLFRIRQTCARLARLIPPLPAVHTRNICSSRDGKHSIRSVSLPIDNNDCIKAAKVAMAVGTLDDIRAIVRHVYGNMLISKVNYFDTIEFAARFGSDVANAVVTSMPRDPNLAKDTKLEMLRGFLHIDDDSVMYDSLERLEVDTGFLIRWFRFWMNKEKNLERVERVRRVVLRLIPPEDDLENFFVGGVGALRDRTSRGVDACFQKLSSEMWTVSLKTRIQYYVCHIDVLSLIVQRLDVPITSILRCMRNPYFAQQIPECAQLQKYYPISTADLYKTDIKLEIQRGYVNRAIMKIMRAEDIPAFEQMLAASKR